MLVVLKEEADLSPAARLATKREKGRFVHRALFDLAERSQASLRAELRARGVAFRAFYVVNALALAADRALVEALAARSEVARVEGNPTVRGAVGTREAPVAARGAPLPTAAESGVVQSKAPLVWATGITGQNVVVGGADTGVDWTHPALKPKYRGWDGTAANHDYSWHDAIHSGGGVCGADAPAPCDDSAHGTHTLGTVVGDDGAGNQIGMAPGARWIACRNMDQGDGTPARYLECMEFFLAPYPVGGTPAQGDPDRAPDVTNNSWSCPASEGCSATTLEAGLAAQRAAGIVTVAAAGNSGPTCSTVDAPPALSASVLTVGALETGTDAILALSSRGPVTADGSGRRKPDLAAPGSETRSSVPGGGYAALSGTSMASPHVAGAAALVLSSRPALLGRVDDVFTILRRSAAPLSASACASTGSPNDVFGFGRLDAKAAVDLARTSVLAFFTLPPCRAFDTRDPAGPYGGPALAANAPRTFALAGRCGIPAAARAVSGNLTVVGPTGAGFLRVYASGQTPPTSSLNFTPGLVRANNVAAALSAQGEIVVEAGMAGGAADALLDVNGWFE